MPDQMPLQPGWDMTEPDAALSAFLESVPVPPRLLGLGEPAHGVEDFPVWRNRVFQSLVDTQGFRSIAIESDIFAGMQANAHVVSGQGTLDDVMKYGFSHGFGAVGANRELLAWMRAFNVGRDGLDRVRFYGFDPPIENMWAASPRQSLLALHAFLARHFTDLPADAATLEHLCGEDARWTNPAAAMNPGQSVGATSDARQLRVLTDDLLAFLNTQLPGLASQSGLWEARLHARTAQGLLRYHAIIADTSPGRISQMLGLRDVLMAGNLAAIAEREAPRGPTLAFAHNSHLQRGASQIRMPSMNADWWPAGAHLSKLLGQRYAFIATASGAGQAGTVKGWLGQQGSSPRLYSTQALTALMPSALSEKAGAAEQPDALLQTDGVLFLPTVAGK